MSKKKPILLDLFCGAGGGGQGYADAGFQVIGVDHVEFKKNTHQSYVMDAFEFMAKVQTKYDVVHASPPCQAYSALKALYPDREWPDLVAATREMLVATGKPYVIENVDQAPLFDPITICGTALEMFYYSPERKERFRLRRHRLFESNLKLKGTPCGCRLYPDIQVMDITGGGGTQAIRKVSKSGIQGGRVYKGSADERRKIMGISWMNRDEITQAIPPRYTKFLGKQIIEQLGG